VFVYPYDRATHQLSASTAPAEALPAGSGPRHLAFHPNGRFLFVVSELVPELRVYRWNARHGRLNLLQTLAAPADPKAGLAKGAEVIVSRDGRFVYISLRGEDTLVAYSVNRRTGVLREVQRIAAGGQSPWSIGIDLSGRWMLVANQASNTIAAFSRDPASGRLAPTGETLAVSKPVSVAYLKGPSCR
jgi:6-phosphogluconolactonase